MLDRPDAATLLGSIAEFLTREVRPQVDDRALAFRLLIASNLLQTLALQEQLGPASETAALTRLRALLADVPCPQEQSPKEQSALLEAALVERIRAGSWNELATPDLLNHLRRSLRDELQIANPRFDTTAEVP